MLEYHLIENPKAARRPNLLPQVSQDSAQLYNSAKLSMIYYVILAACFFSSSLVNQLKLASYCLIFSLTDISHGYVRM